MCTGAQWLDAVRKTMWMWTGAMWAWALLEVVTALKDFTDCGSQCTDILIVGTTVGAGHVVGLWFLGDCAAGGREDAPGALRRTV